jgi:hypothetical protein
VGDEGSLAISPWSAQSARSHPLAHQAPLGFCCSKGRDRSSVRELALRAVPLAASLAALPVFHAFARELEAARAALLALVLFAVCEPLVFYASELKPYATDVLVCLLVAWPAARILSRGASRGRLAALGAAGAVAPWLSLPAVFVCGGAALALGGAFASRRQWPAVRALASLAALWLASFAAEYFLLLRALRANALLAESWQGYFAPLPVSGEALAWWARTFLGFFNDPLGLPASGLAALLFALGIVALARRAPAAGALLSRADRPRARRLGRGPRTVPDELALLALRPLLPVLWPARALLRAARAAGARHRGRPAARCAQPPRGGGRSARARRPALRARAPALQNLADPPRIHEARLSSHDSPSATRRRQDLCAAVRNGVVSYYARRAGRQGRSESSRSSGPASSPTSYFRLRRAAPGRTLLARDAHHPHWRSEVERDAIRTALAPLAEPVETLEGERAEATLYRVRPELRPVE